MIATIPYLQEKFREFNDLCFGGELEDVPIVLGRGKSYIGKCEFKRQRLPFGREKRYGFRLRFNTRADIPEREMEDTVIHEMIHLYILSRGIRDTSAHGKVFRSMMADINAKYGRHITVSHRMSKDERENMQGMKPSWRLIAIVSMTDGRTGIKVLPRVQSSIKRYYRALLASGKVTGMEFRLSRDPYFGLYPRSSAYKVYFPEPEELESHISSAEYSYELKTGRIIPRASDSGRR